MLNITVSRSDGKAAPLLCNYLTTPQMLVYSACLASCAIPGVYEPVELLAKAFDAPNYTAAACSAAAAFSTASGPVMWPALSRAGEH